MDDDWKTRHADRLATPAEAIRLIAPGRCVLIGSGAAEPARLVQSLVEDGAHLADNVILHILTLGPAPYVAPEHAGRFRHLAFFIGANTRQAVAEGRADYIPVFLSEIPELIRSRRVRVDVALIQVSPPDRHGYVSLGVSVDVVRAAVDSASLVIAEVNPRMPRTHGDSALHVSRIARLVPVDAPLPERAPEPLDDVSRAIGEQVASLVPDGATIQTGIGNIPDAVLAALAGRRDLGVHTEMMSDGIMKLAEAGVITGRRKSFVPGKMVTSFVMGSEALYRWVDENPAVELRPSEFTNAPMTIARNDGMVSINSALAVDLTGQVAADTVGGKVYSGIGGQVDFIRGAARSRGGKAILALPSTAKSGTVSRIAAALPEGTAVVTSRGDVRFVATEYGVADLWGRSLRERALALVGIAHPDFRGELMARAVERKLVFPGARIARAEAPWRESRTVKLVDGSEVDLRLVDANDAERVQAMLYRCSDESIYKRFLCHRRVHPADEMRELVDVDEESSFALVAARRDTGEVVGMSRYDVDPATNLGDIAFVVEDAVQRRGLGNALMKRMTEVATARGLAGFSADVLAGNKPMLMVFQDSGLEFKGSLSAGVYHLEAHFDR